MYLMNCFVLLYIALPSATACLGINLLRNRIARYLKTLVLIDGDPPTLGVRQFLHQVTFCIIKSQQTNY